MAFPRGEYKWNVPVPLDADLGLGLLVSACGLLLLAGYCSGIRREALSVNPARLFSAIIEAAVRRGTYWVIWSLVSVGTVLGLASVAILIHLI